MKTTEYRKFTVLACALVLAVICCLPSFAAGKSWVMVTRKAGVVESKLANSESWLRIPNSRRLGSNDSVRTDAKGKAHLKLADNSVIALNPNTNIVLRNFLLNKSQRTVEFDITNGNMRTQVSKFRGRDNRYQVNSPNAVMAAQGTDFGVKVTGEGDNARTVMHVFSGSVLMTSGSNAPIFIQPGQTAVAEGNKIPVVISGTDNVHQNLNGQGEDVNEVENVDLPNNGDQNLQAVPEGTRGEMGGTNNVTGINSIGASGDKTNPSSPVIPDVNTGDVKEQTGTIVIPLDQFTSH